MRFMVIHPLPTGLTRLDVEKMSSTFKKDPEVKGYRSFFNLSLGKGVCVIDSPTEDRLIKWLTLNKLPYDSITPVELEGDHGTFTELLATADVGSGL
jgi:hypothetical protein